MAKLYSGPWVLRTVLFTAGHNERYLEKAFHSDADCIVLDLEDAVPDAMKDKARNLVRDILRRETACKKPVMVRINSIESGLNMIDLESVACKNLCGFVYPKPQCAHDIKEFDAMLKLKEKVLGLEVGHFEIIALIETPRAVLSAYDIAVSSPRVIGLLFGCEDFLADMQGTYGPDQRSLLVPRHMISMAARATGIVPIDTPYVQVHDDSGLREHIQRAKELGYEGMLVMSPRQEEIARECYSPSDKEVNEATEIVQFSDDAAKNKRSIAMYGKKFISPPTLKAAQKFLRRTEVFKRFENDTEG